VSLVTLGVSDYNRAKEFYEALGWSVAWEAQETSFFQANGVVLVLWSREKLASDMGIRDEPARWSGIALAHNVGSREEVREVIELARSIGGQVTRTGRDVLRWVRRCLPRSRRARLGDRTQPRLRPDG
jgi:predicted lactoylglutathione lyase